MELNELDGWSFDVDEISAGVYRALGKDRAGRSVEFVGVDPEELLERCRVAAKEIVASLEKMREE
jgi:hypothetical protein